MLPSCLLLRATQLSSAAVHLPSATSARGPTEQGSVSKGGRRVEELTASRDRSAYRHASKDGSFYYVPYRKGPLRGLERKQIKRNEEMKRQVASELGIHNFLLYLYAYV